MAAAEKMGRDLEDMGVPHEIFPPYPYGTKDANEWLMAATQEEVFVNV